MFKNIKSFWQNSLQTRLTGYFMLLTLFLVSVGPYLSFILSRDALQNSVVERLITASALKEADLNRWVSDREQDILLLAQEPSLYLQAEVLVKDDTLDPFFSTSYQGLSSYLRRVLEHNQNYTELFILTDVGGKIVFSTAPEHEGEYHVTDVYFTEGRQNLFTQNVYPSPLTGEPLMTIAIPILNRHGEHIGVLAAHLNMDKLDEIILERTGLGTSGETYLVNQYNSFVSEAKFGLKDFPRGVHSEGIDAALGGKDGSGLYLNYQGIPVIGAYRWIPERELALLTEINQQEAFAHAQQLALFIFLVGLGAAFAASISVYFVARQITEPILAITATATDIAAGDLSKTAPVLTRDEIGSLAQSFNSVTARARDLISNLEERVAERTHDLALRSAHLEGAAEVSHAAATFTDPEELSRRVVDLIRDRFHLYYVGLFLVEGNWAVLHAGTGKAGATMLTNKHRLKIGEGMIGWAVQNAEARIALDVGEDAVRFENPVLPETRSEGALPLRSRGRVLGALTVQSREPEAFTLESITTLQTMADQIAVAFDNAELLANREAALKAERRAYGQLSLESWRALQGAGQFPAYQIDEYGNLDLAESEDPEKEMIAIASGEILQDDGRTTLLPIQVRGNVIGGIRISKKAGSGKWTPAQRQLLATISEQLSDALESARLFEETQRWAKREALISNIAAKISSSIRIDNIIQTTVRELGETLGTSEIAFELVEPQKKTPAVNHNDGEK